MSARRPAAMLLDFGGVLVDVRHRGMGLAEVAAEVHALLRRERANSLRPDRIERDVRAGWAAYADWKRAQSRRPRPRELRHEEFWGEFVAADWPARARETVVAHASELSERIDVATKERPAKADALATLQALAQLGLPIAVVSNALAGSGSRKLQHAHGFEAFLGAQIYSDEVAMRKPNPGIFERAASELGVELARCWYVGDTVDRDVLGPRRAGVEHVVLLPSPQTGLGPDVIATPDHVIARPIELLALLPDRSGP